jgi:hypothetical protein
VAEDAIVNGSVVVAGGVFVDDFVVASDRFAQIDGGTIHELQLNSESQTDIRGGQQAQIDALDGAAVDIFGWGFSIDGMPLNGLAFGQPIPIIDRDVTLQGTLADGSPFTYELNTQFQIGEDFFDDESVVNVVLAPPLGDYNADGAVDAADYVVMRKLGGAGFPTAYEDWRARFNETVGGNAGSGSVERVNALVPEPSAVAMLILALAAGFGFRRAQPVSY